MEHMKILKRSWTIVWRYKALWLFGFLFALAGGGGGSSGGGSGGGRPNVGAGPSGGNGSDWPFGPIPSIDWNVVWIIVAVAVAVIILLAIVMTIVRYVSETAMIAGVDEVEGTGEKLTVRRGFRLGWSRQALRLFLVDLVVGLPLALVIIVLLVLGLSPLVLLALKSDVARVIGIVAAIGLELLVILFIIAVSLAVSVVMPYIRRRVVLGKQGILASIRQGVAMVRGALMDTGLMWLLLVGVQIVQWIVMIPILILVVAIAMGVGGVPGGLIYLASKSWVPAAIVGGLLFLVVLIPPLTFVRGLFELYLSTSWTLAYRDVVARHSDLLPAPDAA
jgi:hypothetical protein